MTPIRELSGQTFGNLLALWPVGVENRRYRLWAVQCACGLTSIVRACNLITGNTKTCATCRHEKVMSGEPRLSHGHKRGKRPTSEYSSWAAAKQRCTNPRNVRFPIYGGRGIEMRFATFAEFFEEIGPKPSSELTLDRIDNNGHYEVGNVRWATTKQQAANKRKREKVCH